MNKKFIQRQNIYAKIPKLDKKKECFVHKLGANVDALDWGSNAYTFEMYFQLHHNFE